MDYDVVVLGAGPGGYEAAIRCAQLGLKTALIEAAELGGTCLNRGCIPTKTLLHSAEIYESAKEAAAYGVSTGEVTFDYAAFASRKDSVVARLRGGIASQEKAHGVTVIQGFGVLKDAHTVTVGDGEITAESIILATGSAPARPPIPGIDGENVVTSDEVLAMTRCPESVVIIGGGVIGIEFATLFATLGKAVTVIEMLPSILPGVDTEIVQRISRILKKKGVKIFAGAKVTAIEGGKSASVHYELDGKSASASGELCVVSVGRRPSTANMGLEALGIKMIRGYVDVDSSMRTSISNIYAIGDITGKIQLAHVATAQSMVAAENVAGGSAKMDYEIVPSCIYTSPEIACVGITVDKATEAGKQVKTGIFNLAANGKAMVMGSQAGLVKLVSDARTGEILGAQIMAPRATDMIAEIAAVMRCEGTIEELADTIHPHPTISETVMAAAQEAVGV